MNIVEMFDEMRAYTPTQIDENAKFKAERAMIAEREEKTRKEALVIGEKKRSAHSLGIRDTMDLPAQPVERYESITEGILKSQEDIPILDQLQGESKQRWLERYGDK